MTPTDVLSRSVSLPAIVATIIQSPTDGSIQNALDKIRNKYYDPGTTLLAETEEDLIRKPHNTL
jgi:hypothetical protein